MLQDAINAALPALRSEAEARMTSRCTIRRRSGVPVQDEDTGAETYPWIEVYTDLPLRLDGGHSEASHRRTDDAGGVEVETALRTAHLPATTTGLQDGDLIDVTSGESSGLVLRIVEATWADQQTARRVPVVSVQRPEEW